MVYKITREQAGKLAEAAGVRRRTPRYVASVIIKQEAMAAFVDWCKKVPMIDNPASRAHAVQQLEWQVLTKGVARLDIDGHTFQLAANSFDVRLYRVEGEDFVNMADGSKHTPMVTSWQGAGTVVQYEDTAADTVDRLYRSVCRPDFSPDWVIDTRGDAVEIRVGYGPDCWTMHTGAGEAARLTMAARTIGFNVEVIS